jgi:hypothetical protein
MKMGFVRRAPICRGPPRAPIGKSATACDFALRLVRRLSSRFRRVVRLPPIAALTIDPEINVMGQF